MLHNFVADLSDGISHQAPEASWTDVSGGAFEFDDSLFQVVDAETLSQRRRTDTDVVTWRVTLVKPHT